MVFRALRLGEVAVLFLALTFAVAPAAAQVGAARPGGQASAASQPVETHPAPAFVVEHDPVAPGEATHPPLQGVRALLIDTQHDATGRESAMYLRQVVEAATYAGVSPVSQLAVPFDPVYQRFELNHVRVTRAGVVEDRRDRAHLDFLQREEGLEKQMVTGALTAALRLDDVRAGDVVDIAYTVYGGPIQGKDAQTFLLGLPGPVERFALRTRWPAGARWKVMGDGPSVRETREGESVLLEVEPRPLEATEIEALAPPWEPVLPFLSAASFGDWSDVADWGAALFRVESDPEVKALAASIARQHPGKPEQVAAALRFVQQEVRYLALVLGEGGYTPAPPGQTLASRLGDCKAKTLLLLALMDALGVDAVPALVTSVGGQGLPDLPPSPSAFNHVVTRVSLGGKTYWLDATNQFQGGSLDNLAQPDFGYALPLAPRTRGLVRMSPPETPGPTTIVREDYDLRGGTTKPGMVHVESIRTGEPADVRRALYAVYGKTEVENGIVELYKSRYGGAELVAESAVEDDLEANRFAASYDLTLAKPFTPRAGGDAGADFVAIGDTIASFVVDPKTDGRRFPLMLVGQAHARHEMVFRLPDVLGLVWSRSLPTEDETIENAAFRFRRTSKLDGLVYTVTLEIDTLAEAIAPDQIAGVLADQKRMEERRRQSLWLSSSAKASLPALDLPPIDLKLAPIPQ